MLGLIFDISRLWLLIFMMTAFSNYHFTLDAIYHLAFPAIGGNNDVWCYFLWLREIYLIDSLILGSLKLICFRDELFRYEQPQKYPAATVEWAIVLLLYRNRRWFSLAWSPPGHCRARSQLSPHTTCQQSARLYSQISVMAPPRWAFPFSNILIWWVWQFHHWFAETYYAGFCRISHFGNIYKNSTTFLWYQPRQLVTTPFHAPRRNIIRHEREYISLVPDIDIFELPLGAMARHGWKRKLRIFLWRASISKISGRDELLYCRDYAGAYEDTLPPLPLLQATASRQSQSPLTTPMSISRLSRRMPLKYYLIVFYFIA